MKVILLEDVYNQGVAGDVVDVAPGFARNYLIPKQLAVKATPGALKQLETLRANAAKRRAELEGRMEQVAQQIEGLTLYFPVKASERGKLFGSVTTQEIAERLKEEIGLEIDPRRVGDNPLRELGKFDVPVRLETGLVANVRVVVHREDEDPRQAEQAEAEAESEDVAAQPEAELAETAEAAADEAPAEEAAEEA
ncbi:MAG: 50S ribosomal protein L9 [Aggregatilineales bacterium]|jgi:large subunit ribosomal protein L9|nr:50S ribosomal protein L9 [Chloroflexota bacterium]HOA24527.1 50S ribosomal protein L9 [Aggregatilineales bacterium]HPV05619.1 50S ribosomal protein L9 [Aggregatilineales bacterium]